MFLAAEYGFMFYRFRELVCLRRPSRQSRSAPPASHMLTGWVPCEAAGASRFTAHTKSPQSQSVHRLQGKPSFNDGVKKKEKEKWNDFFIWSEIKWNHICLPTNNQSFNVFHWFFIIFSLTFSHVSKCNWREKLLSTACCRYTDLNSPTVPFDLSLAFKGAICLSFFSSWWPSGTTFTPHTEAPQ